MEGIAKIRSAHFPLRLCLTGIYGSGFRYKCYLHLLNAHSYGSYPNILHTIQKHLPLGGLFIWCAWRESNPHVVKHWYRLHTKATIVASWASCFSRRCSKGTAKKTIKNELVLGQKNLNKYGAHGGNRTPTS